MTNTTFTKLGMHVQTAARNGAHQSRATWFANLSTRTKILLGSGVLVLALVVVAGISVLALRAVQDDFSAYRNLARQSNELGRVQANLLAARLAAKDFVLRNDQASVAALEDRVATSRQVIADARSIVADQDGRKTLEAIETDLDDYSGFFKKVVALQAESNDLVRRMDELGPEIEKNLNQIMQSANADNDASAAFLAGQSLRSLLLARLNAFKFLTDSQAANRGRADENLADFVKIATEMQRELQNPVRRQLAEKVIADGAAYRSTFEQVATAFEAKNAIISAELDRIGPKIATEAEEMKLANKAEQDYLGPHAERRVSEALLEISIIAGLAILLGGLFALLIGRMIGRPIQSITGVMNRLAEGELEVDMPYAGRRDEVGQMAQALDVFKDNAIERRRMAEAELAAAEDRTRRAEQRDALTEAFKASVDDVMQALSSASTQLESTAQLMSATAEETSAQATTVSAATEQASASVQTVAASAEELAASIREVTANITQTSSLADKANREAGGAVEAIDGVRAGAEKISGVINIISEIASQTNLLALNATIEAARAGEAGKGFAVVASEVKQLANETGKATGEISNQIKEMQSSVEACVPMIRAIEEIIGELSEIATRVAAAAEEQSAATTEISRSGQQAATGTEEVSMNVRGLQEASVQTSAGATQVLSAAASVNERSAAMRQEIERYIAGMAQV